LARRPARRHLKSRQRIRGDVGLARAYFAPGDVAVAVGVQRERIVEIAEGDIPLPSYRAAVALERQIGVARLVRERGDRAERGEQKREIALHGARLPDDAIVVASRTSSSLVVAIQSSTMRIARASPAVCAAPARIARSAGSRWTAQFASASLSAPAGSCSISRRKRASSRRGAVWARLRRGLA